MLSFGDAQDDIKGRTFPKVNNTPNNMQGGEQKLYVIVASHDLCFAQAAFHVSKSDLLPKRGDSAVMRTSTVHNKMTAKKCPLHDSFE